MLNITLPVPQRHHAVTLFPLVAADEAELPYERLVDALEVEPNRIRDDLGREAVTVEVARAVRHGCAPSGWRRS